MFSMKVLLTSYMLVLTYWSKYFFNVVSIIYAGIGILCI